MINLRRYLILVFFLLHPAASNALVDIATVTDAKGTVAAVSPAGDSRALETGGRIALGETITTGGRSWVKLEFDDQSEFTLGPQTRMNVSEFATGGANESPSFVSTISVGVFRFVSGLIAREDPSAMLVKSAVANIGIRGTHVLGKVGEETATVILLEPEEQHPTAISVSNAFGSVTIDEPGYGTDVPDAGSAPTPPRKMNTRTINNMMNSIRSMQRINPTNIPRPVRR